MQRTAQRPIPAGRIPTGSAFVFGGLMCTVSLMLTFLEVNKLAALFTLLTIVAYLGCYTPAKRWSRWSTEIGAVAGAFPPLIGWAAGEDRVSALGWILRRPLLLADPAFHGGFLDPSPRLFRRAFSDAVGDRRLGRLGGRLVVRQHPAAGRRQPPAGVPGPRHLVVWRRGPARGRMVSLAGRAVSTPGRPRCHRPPAFSSPRSPTCRSSSSPSWRTG